ncbi:MAG: TackOD1 domain-containing metal-binding protein [Candidatus Bathycorpusculaceae bacterium]
MQRKNKAERLELYRDRDTQVLLGKFLSGEINVLEPAYDSQVGYRYPTVEAIVGDSSKVALFLNKLYEAKILERKLYDKVIYCPKCGSANISIRYCCPYCKSFDIQKSSLIEHVKCGYMDVQETFLKGAKLVCPKCEEELKKVDVDYRKAGIWCSCKDCGKSFDIPVSAHFCRSCHENFTFEEATIADVYSYSLNEEVKGEAPLAWVLITPVQELLVDEGFHVESPAFVKGKSGANHRFDIAASKGTAGKLMVIDLSSSVEGEVSEQPVIALFAKIFDVSPDKAYLIAVPKINENGKKMAELYNIQIIEARNQKEVVKALKEKLKK